MGLGMMAFYTTLCTVHTTQGQGQGQTQETIVSHCASPVPCPGPRPVQCVWALQLNNYAKNPATNTSIHASWSLQKIMIFNIESKISFPRWKITDRRGITVWLHLPIILLFHQMFNFSIEEDLSFASKSTILLNVQTGRIDSNHRWEW